MNRNILIDCAVGTAADAAVWMAQEIWGEAWIKTTASAQRVVTPLFYRHIGTTTEYSAGTEYVWDLIYQVAKEADGGLELITLGPLTNLAVALFKYEDLNRYIRKIVVMGGSVTTGSSSAYAEVNVVEDPHAFRAVLDSGIEIELVGLEVIRRMGLSDKEYFSGKKEAEIHACVTMAAALKPELVQSKRYQVMVETASGQMYGRTVIDRRLHSCAEPNASVVESLDQEELLNLIRRLEYG